MNNKELLVSNPNNTINFNINDLESFQKMVLLALGGTIAGEIIFFINTIVGVLLIFGGFLSFTFSILFISKKYNELYSSSKIVILLVISFIVDLITSFI